MPFYPNQPTEHTLADIIGSTPPDMDPMNWQVLAIKGDPGASFPYPGDAIIQGNGFVQGELGLFENDPGGSGESGVHCFLCAICPNPRARRLQCASETKDAVWNVCDR